MAAISVQDTIYNHVNIDIECFTNVYGQKNPMNWIKLSFAAEFKSVLTVKASQVNLDRGVQCTIFTMEEFTS